MERKAVYDDKIVKRELRLLILLVFGLFSLAAGEEYSDGNEPILGDLNGDGIVDYIDFAAMAQNWLSASNNLPPYSPPIDENSAEYSISYLEGLNAFHPDLADIEGNDVWRNDGNDAYAWRPWTGPVFISQHIDNQQMAFSQDDGYCVKVEGKNNWFGQAIVYRDIFPRLNVNSCHVRLNYFVPYDPNVCINRVRIYLDDNYGRALYIFTLPGTPGYHETEFALAGCAGFDASDMNNLSRMRIGFDYRSGATGIMYIDSVRIVPNLSVPRVILCFDNGYTNHYEVVRPLLNAHGFKGVFYVITNYIGLPGFMTAEQILQLQAEGHLIGNHSVSHRLWQGQSMLPPALYWERVREMVDAVKALKSIGINEGRRYFCLPSGSSWIAAMTPAQKNQALRFLLQYNTHVRMTADVGYVDGQVAAVCGNYPNPPRNSRLSWALLPSSLDDAKARISKAVMDKSLVVFFWHYIMDKPQGDMTVDEFSQLLDYIQEKNCQVITFKDLLQSDNN